MRRLLTRVRNAAGHLAGRTVFDQGLYREAELARLLNLFTHVDLERWRGMRVLEVGAGLGEIGRVFTQLGFDVTSTDGRAELVERMKARGRNAFVLDLDSVSADQIRNYDLVLSFGVLYHLTHPERLLRAAGSSAKALVLESVVCDTAEPVVHVVTESKGRFALDQALNEYGCRPSPAWVEQRCHEAGFDRVRDISSPVGNWTVGRFDWQPCNSGVWRRNGVNYRKMWVCEKATQGVG
jgi:SAM-dependent methyltransferase